VAHESLLREWQRLRGWLDQSRADVRQQRLLASATAEWLAMGRDAGFLLSGGRLDQFSGWVENSTIALTSEEQEFLAVSMAVRADQVAAELARQQRELQTAQQLADTERERAEEQTHSNRRLRQRAVLLAVALLVAAVLAVLAIVAGLQSNENAEIAQANAALAITREAEAVLEAEQRASAESVAIAEREFAQAQERKAQARGLAGAAVKNLQIDPELSVLLALEAIETTYNEDKSWEPEAVDALHQAINAVSRLEDTLIHSGGAMNHVTYSPDGTRLGASTLLADQPVMTTVWDTATGEELFTLPTSIAMFNKEGSRLITWRVERGKELIWEIWDATSGEKLDTVPLTIDDIAYSISGTINPDWRYFANRYWDGTINVWDMTTREQIMHLTEHENMATWVEISPDNQYVVSADMAGLVKVWPISAESSGAITETASLITLPHNGYVETMAYSLDSHYLATISDDYTVTLWDIPASVVTETPTKLSQFPLTGHAERISQIAFNVDGTQLAAVSQDGEVKVWDALSGTELLTVFSNKHTRHIAFSPSGSHLVTANDGGLVQIWDITPAGEEEVLTLNAHHGIANHVAYSPDGTQLATAGNDERVRVWNADTGELLITLAGHSDNVWAVAFGPDGMQLASASNDGTIKLWDTDSWRELSELAAFSEFPLNPIPENNDLDLAFSRDGTRLFVTGMSSNPQIWDLTTGEKVTSLYGHDYNVPALALSLDGSQLATVGVEGQVIVWDSQTGRQILKEATSIYGSLDVAFSPDGQKLATADDDGTVRVWGLDEPYGERLLFTLSGHGAAVRNVAFSPDGRFIASGSANLIRIWDAETGESLYSLPGHSRVVTDIEFSPDNMHLASTGADGTVRIYVLPVNDLMLLAKSHVTRTLTNAECILYLQADTCPE
jgi:WD40 repeat protein